MHYVNGAGHSAQGNKVWSHNIINIQTNQVNVVLESIQTEQTEVEVEEGRWRSRKRRRFPHMVIPSFTVTET